jgi:tRNA modification GTPase
MSARDGTGLSLLSQRLNTHVQAFFGSESGVITRERHRFDLEAAEQALGRALAEGLNREEIIAEELRLASRALGRLTGKVDVEDVLDVIFRDFCIGK